MQAIFDYLLTQLNDNTDDLVYKGNYVFRFFTDSMSVLEAVTGKLVNEEIEFSPVALMTKSPVPFVENNKRIDWLLEFGILTRIAGSEYDSTTDLDYANIKGVLDDLQGEVVTISSKKYAFKTNDLNYSGYTMLGRSKYAILTFTINVTQIDYGYFGQESVWKIDTTTLDVFNANITSTRRYYSSDEVDDTTNDFNKCIGRSMVFELTINYNGETDLLDERYGVSTLAKQYTLTETFNSVTKSYTVTCESANELQQSGKVKQLILRFVEV